MLVNRDKQDQCSDYKPKLYIRKNSPDIYVREQIKTSQLGFSPIEFWLKPNIFPFIFPDLKVGAIA